MISFSTLRGYIGRFPSCRVAILGDIMVDRFIYGDVLRISPEAPVPVVAVRRRITQPGGAGNVARNVVSLGGRASLFGYIGSDEAGAEIRQLLTQSGVEIAGVTSPRGCCTTVKTRVVARSQHMLRIDEESEDAVDTGAPEALLTGLRNALAGFDVLAISDYAKGVVGPVVAGAAIAMCREAGKPVLVDPKPVNVGLYSGASLIKPNMGEALTISGKHGRDVDQLVVGQRVAHASGASAVVITAGADGMYLFETGRLTHLPGHARDVYDVAGGGTQLWPLWPWELLRRKHPEAAELGNLAGSRAVGHLGVAAITADELLEELQDYETAH